MSSIVSVVLTGFVGRDPELRYTQNGKAVLNFSVAVNRRWKKGDEWMEETQWYKVAVWEQKAESIAKILKKGHKVTIVADWIEAKTFIKKDGEAAIELSLIAKHIDVSEKLERQEPNEEVEVDEEIPF